LNVLDDLPPEKLPKDRLPLLKERPPPPDDLIPELLDPPNPPPRLPPENPPELLPMILIPPCVDSVLFI